MKPEKAPSILWSKRYLVGVGISVLILFTVFDDYFLNSLLKSSSFFDNNDDVVVDAVTGSYFSGNKVTGRHFPHADILFRAKVQRPGRPLLNSERLHPACVKWAVVTTINAPTEAIMDLSARTTWCTVIVADLKTPPLTTEEKKEFQMNNNVVFLSVRDQRSMATRFPKLFELIPWNHFGRKNIGYLFAIEQGAEVIWDFDDDNTLIADLTETFDALCVPGLDAYPMVTPDVNVSSCLSYNPYPTLGAPLSVSSRETEYLKNLNLWDLKNIRDNETIPAWPRGFPLSYIRNPDCSTKHIRRWRVHTAQSVGMIQSLANHEPDVDGIFRLTQQIPFDFDSQPASIVDGLKKLTGQATDPSQQGQPDTPQHTMRPLLVIPHRVLVPTNAQAQLSFQKAMWGLLLPITVHGRVSDIWRGYIMQRLMWDADVSLAFSSPLVTQIRNPHNPLKDMAAEWPLYMKSHQLVTFLTQWTSKLLSMQGRIEELYIELYERDFIELKDVLLVQQWIQSLTEVGYQFPVVKWCHMHGQRYACASLYSSNSLSQMMKHPSITHKKVKDDRQIGWQSKISFMKWKKNLQVLRPERMPVLKVVVMAKDEWPLLRSFVYYYGELIGFENIYILDSSVAAISIDFLTFVRDSLGVNVIFTPANLNGIHVEINQIMTQLVFSSNYLIKLDVDEFLTLAEPNRKCSQSPQSMNGSSSESARTHVSCEFSTTVSDFKLYLQNLSDVNTLLEVQRVASSASERQACEDASSAMKHSISIGQQTCFTSTLDFQEVGHTFKVMHQSVLYRDVDLGAHNGHNWAPFRNDKSWVKIGLIHLHARCMENNLLNDYKACVSHGYLSELDDKATVREKLLNMTGPDPFSSVTGGYASHHKVQSVAQFVADPKKYKQNYYISSSDCVTILDLQKQIQHVLEKYRLSENEPAKFSEPSFSTLPPALL